MQPLRILLILAAILALALALILAFTLTRGGSGASESVAIAAGLYLTFLAAWGGAFAWTLRHEADLREILDRTQKVAEGAHEQPIAGRLYQGELDELARAIEEVREAFRAQRSSFEELSGAISQILGGLGEGLLAISPAGRVVLANERVAEMFGDPGTLAGKKVIEVVRKRSVVGALEQALHGKASTERVVAESGGRERQIEIRAFPVRSREIAAVALFIDMTEIERLHKIRKDFLEDFSHEVRTPLAGLRSAAETLQAGGLAIQDEEALRQVMLRQLSRIERLVKDLSELNRIESGELVLDRRPVVVRDVLRDLCADFRERLAGKALTIRLEGDDTAAIADTLRLQQIFTNLLDNAWKHGGARGEIVVEVGRENGDAVVKVSDDGEGIPPGEAERIFNRFYRVDRSRSQTVPGLGLGLAITKHLVLLHGGSIRALSRPGGGATFEVRLPAA